MPLRLVLAAVSFFGRCLYGPSSVGGVDMFRRLVLAVFFAPSVVLAVDCQCCEGIENIPGLITNAVLSSCSSNCVRMSPAVCLEVKEKLQSGVYDIHEELGALLSYVQSISSSVDQMRSYVDSVRHSVNWVIGNLAEDAPNVDAAIASLSNARTRLITFSNVWHDVNLNVQGVASSSLFVSNIYTAVTQRFPAPRTPMYLAKMVVPLLDDALDKLSNHTNVLASVNSDLENVLERCEYMYVQLDNISFQVESYIQDFPRVQELSDGLAETLSSFDCQSCGSGPSSDDDDDGGTQDMTPIVAAINELKSRLDYWAEKIHDLIYNFYTDYDAARSSSVSGAPSLASYNLIGDNWFKRVEYLLYSAAYSSMDDEDTDNPPDSPSAYEQINARSQAVNDSMSADKDRVQGIVSASLGRFRTSFNQLSSHLVNFVPRGDGSLSSPVLSYGDSGTVGRWSIGIDVDMLSSSHGVGSFFETMRIGMRIFWSFLIVSLYSVCLFLYVRWIVAGFRFLYTSVIDALS